jgi:hypothetical protein
MCLSCTNVRAGIGSADLQSAIGKQNEAKDSDVLERPFFSHFELGTAAIRSCSYDCISVAQLLRIMRPGVVVFLE